MEQQTSSASNTGNVDQSAPHLSRWNHIPQMIAWAAEKYMDQVAHTTYLPNGFHCNLSFKETHGYSSALAGYLTGVLKLVKGDRVAIQMPNCVAYPIALFGIMQAGCVAVNINPLYTTHELEHPLEDSGAKAIIVIDLFLEKLEKIVAKKNLQKIIVVSMADFFPQPLKTLIKLKLRSQIKSIPGPCIAFTEALKQGAKYKNPYKPHLTPDDMALLQYTGGTTGVSKGAKISHGNLLAQVYQFTEFTKHKVNQGKEVVLTVLPLYHIFSLTINGICFFSVGAHNIFIPNPRPLLNLKKAFQKYNITWMAGVNTLFYGLLKEPWFKIHYPKNIKVVISGGMALHEQVSENWKKLVGKPLFCGYGLTEASPVVSFQPMEDNAMLKPHSVGIPIPLTEIKIIDDSGKECVQGTSGEVLIRGPQVMQGYWNDSEQNSSIIKNNWLYTGDIGYLDEDNHLVLVDRKKDMILVSGFNVYPNEVENCITKLEGVQEVGVIGVADDISGEIVKACVVKNNPELTEQDIKNHCRQYLSAYKVPKKIEFYKELPKNAVGKILRKSLRS